ncbi:thioredoxin family protein [Bacillaceae bacterium IKA-2]|nr:thioredoxin family protein [Bacillaceae bacterium IKA-2]
MHEITEAAKLKQIISEEEIVLVLLKSEKCSVCDAVYEQLGDFFIEGNDFKKYYVSIDKVASVAGEYLVFTAPTVLLFINGKEVERQSRFISYDKINYQITRYTSI